MLRERDFLSGQIGQYLKIGVTEREVDKRIKEHQTGNAREVFSIYEKHVPFMSKMETHLHHNFSTERINGEWFDLTEQRVQSEVIPFIEKLSKEQEAFMANSSHLESYLNLPDSGLIRDPDTEEKQLFEEYKSVDKALIVAKAKNKLLDLRIRNFIIESKGIHGVVSLHRKSQSNYFNKASFIKSLSPSEYALCHNDVVEFSSKVKFSHAANIKNLNLDLKNELKTQEQLIKDNALTLSNLSKSLSERSVEVENIHAEYLSSRKDFKALEWNKELLTSEFLSKLGIDREIRGVVSWVRENVEVKNKWCLKSARQHLSRKVEDFTKPRPDIVVVEIADGRSYKLAKT